MSEREFETWAGRFLISSASADDRQAQLAIAAETIERDMVIWFGNLTNILIVECILKLFSDSCNAFLTDLLYDNLASSLQLGFFIILL